MTDGKRRVESEQNKRARFSRRQFLLVTASVGSTSGCLQLEQESGQNSSPTPRNTSPATVTSAEAAGSLNEVASFTDIGSVISADFEYAGDDILFRAGDRAFAIRPSTGTVLWEVEGIDYVRLLGVTPNSIITIGETNDSKRRIVRYADGVLENSIEVNSLGINDHPSIRDTSPAISYDKIFYTWKDADERQFYITCRSPQTLEEKWTIEAPAISGISTEDTIYLHHGETGAKIDIETGKKTMFQTSGEVGRSYRHVFHGPLLFIYGRNKLHALDPTTFDIQWSVEWDYLNHSMGPIRKQTATQHLQAHSMYPIVTCDGSDSIYFAVKSTVKRIKKESGDVVWTSSTSEDIVTRPTYAGSSVVVGTANRTIGISVEDGSKLWNISNHGPDRHLAWNDLVWLPTQLSGYDPESGEEIVNQVGSAKWLWPHQGNLLAGDKNGVEYYKFE